MRWFGQCLSSIVHVKVLLWLMILIQWILDSGYNMWCHPRLHSSYLVLQLRKNVLFLGELLMDVLSRSTQQNNESELAVSKWYRYSRIVRKMPGWSKAIMSFKSSWLWCRVNKCFDQKLDGALDVFGEAPNPKWFDFHSQMYLAKRQINNGSFFVFKSRSDCWKFVWIDELRFFPPTQMYSAKCQIWSGLVSFSNVFGEAPNPKWFRCTQWMFESKVVRCISDEASNPK